MAANCSSSTANGAVAPWQAMFDVTADGRFLMGRQLRRTELRLVVVTRFLDELERRAVSVR